MKWCYAWSLWVQGLARSRNSRCRSCNKAFSGQKYGKREWVSEVGMGLEGAEGGIHVCVFPHSVFFWERRGVNITGKGACPGINYLLLPTCHSGNEETPWNQFVHSSRYESPGISVPSSGVPKRIQGYGGHRSEHLFLWESSLVDVLRALD